MMIHSSLKLVKKMVLTLGSFFQPSNSPNFDIVDLGISRAIQAIEIKKDAKSVDGFIPSVQQVHSLKVHFLF